MERLRQAESRFLVTPSPAEVATAEGTRRLMELNRRVPELRRFAPDDNIDTARRVLTGVPKLLRDNPQLVTDLIQASNTIGEGKTTMLVLPDSPLVLADTGSTITALAPVLSCTRAAIEKAFAPMPQAKGRYDVLVSDGGLDDAVWESVERGERFFNFDPTAMDPADYLRLAVRTFTNETFRMRFRKGDPTFTPLSSEENDVR